MLSRAKETLKVALLAYEKDFGEPLKKSALQSELFRIYVEKLGSFANKRFGHLNPEELLGVVKLLDDGEGDPAKTLEAVRPRGRPRKSA